MDLSPRADRPVRSAPEVFLSGITKRFGPVTALRSVDLRLTPGHVHALLGENGAGKSTLVSVLFGLVRADHGSVFFDGVETPLLGPRHAMTMGLGIVQQHFSNVSAFTVAENVAMGGRGQFHPAAAADRVFAAAGLAGLTLDPSARVGDLSVEAQQRVEIVRALARDARILILDEPTAVLAPDEAAALLAWLRRFADTGGSVLLVTHKVREALEVADDITVLRAGERIVTGPVDTFSVKALAAAMFPDAPAEDAAPVLPAPLLGSVVVRARGLSLVGSRGEQQISHATFTLREGEIVGIAAVEGAGHAALLRALAGVRSPDAGELELPPEVSFIPADRQRDALVMDFPLFENLALRHAGDLRGRLHWASIRRRTRAVIEAFDVRAASESSSARALSGGNQQRFVLGRELEFRPRLLVAENPTRGLDLRATAAVQDRLRRAARNGTAIVMYSTELDEVFAMADRIFVVHRGEIRDVPKDRGLVARAMVGDW